MENAYRQRTDELRIQKIRENLSGLPASCTHFIRSIATTTSTLTRFAYSIDLRIFYEYAFKELPYFQGDSMQQITDEELCRLTVRDIDGYADYLSLYYKRETDGADDAPIAVVNHEYGIMRKLSSLRSYFDYLFREHRIPGNVATLVPLPKLHDKTILRLEQDETASLLRTVLTQEGFQGRQKSYLAHTQARDYAMLMLFLGTGMRVSECVGINLDDLDFANNAVLVTRKGGNQVMLYFPPEVAEALLAYGELRREMKPLPDHEQAFFLSLQNKRITQRAVQLMVKKYARIVVPLKKRISPHKLRSTYATNLYHETGDIYLVADALGHSNVNTTRKHYAAMTDARRREAARHVRLPGKEPDETPAPPPSEPEQ